MGSRGDQKKPERNAAAAPGLAYGARVGDRLRRCALAGPLAGANAVGEAGSRECGSLVCIELRIEAGRIEQARYQALGCPATLASASQVCHSVVGSTVLEAASVSQTDVCQELGLVPEKEYTAGVALDALHEALATALTDPGCEVRPATGVNDRGILVGMSGGVDSAVAALLLGRQGFHVVGATLRLWAEPGVVDERSCCSPENVRRARRVAHSLGMPHVTLDAGAAFHRDVVEYFVSEYAAGRTPNPCAKCNSRLRVATLVGGAERLGLGRVGTGHYARLIGSPRRLARGADPQKDQSYVLAEVAPGLLDRLVFPLGEMRKQEVRAIAARARLEGHSVPESQEICFVADDDHRRFLAERLGELPGTVVDMKGRELGLHKGTYNFTIGQRRGLRIAAGDPRYVVSIDAADRLVVVGTAADAQVGSVEVAGLVWHRAPGSEAMEVQVRSAGASIPLGDLAVRDDGMCLTLAQPASGVAPGQTAVVYEDDKVIVAGTIASTKGWGGSSCRDEPGKMAGNAPMI